MAYSHPRWDGMGIDDEIRGDTLCSERHVFVVIRYADSAFLAMTGREFVADLWYTSGTDTNLHEFQAVTIRSNDDLVNNAIFGALQRCRHIATGVRTKPL